MQPTLKQLFAAAAAAKATPPAACEAPWANGSTRTGEAAPRASVAAPPLSKENVPDDATAAAAAPAPGAKQPQQQPWKPSPSAAASGPAARSGGSTKQPSKSTQLFLDLGQRDFGASRCSVCGMMYARGHAEDEKLHKAFHNSTLAALKFQGWAQERVVLSQPSRGRLLLVLQSDAAPQLKKVQELCSFVERAHGMPVGWLLSAPRAQVFLYVSAQKRVVGLAVVEPLKQAYRVVAAAAGGGEQEADSSQQAAASSAPQPQQRQPLLWPGLQRSSGRRLLEQRGAMSAGTSLLSDPSALTPVGTGGCSSSGVKADSCPNSLLLAAGAMQVEAAAAAVDEGQTQTSQQQQEQQGMPPPLPRVQPPQQQQDTSSGHAPPAATAAASRLRAGGSSNGGRSLRVDKRKPLRAMLGVRMVWVLPEQRRKGLATQMLDAARCNMVPGYVVPCAQMAFSQPSGDGAALAAAFTSTQQFLVYGMD